VKLFRRRREREVFIGFSNRIGILDLQGLEEYVGEGDVERIYLVVREPLNERVRAYLESRPELAERVEIVLSDDVRGEVRRLKRENKGFKVRVQDMREFGKRAMSGDLF